MNRQFMNEHGQWYQLIGSRWVAGARGSPRPGRTEVCRVGRTPGRAYWRVPVARLPRNPRRHQIRPRSSLPTRSQTTSENLGTGGLPAPQRHRSVPTTSPRALKLLLDPPELNQRVDTATSTTGKPEESPSTEMETHFTPVWSFGLSRAEIWRPWTPFSTGCQKDWNCPEERGSSSVWTETESTGLRSWRMEPLTLYHLIRRSR